jgi:hypothetical protein
MERLSVTHLHYKGTFHSYLLKFLSFATFNYGKDGNASREYCTRVGITLVAEYS